MDYLMMKSFHLVSVVALIMSFGIIITGNTIVGNGKIKKLGYMTHGISWLCVLGSAFGLVDILSLHENFPNWAKGKFYAFLILGAWGYSVKKKPKKIHFHILIVFFLSSIAVVLAVYKPTL